MRARSLRSHSQESFLALLVYFCVFVDKIDYCEELAIDSKRGLVSVSSRALAGKALTECSAGYEISDGDGSARGEVVCAKHNRTNGRWEPTPPTCERASWGG